MSYTEVFAAFEDGAMRTICECHNSWHGAMWIWQELAKKYLSVGDKDYAGIGALMMDMSPVWKLADGKGERKVITDEEWYALTTTFDGVLVPRELMLVVADALADFSPGTENLAKQATNIREAHAGGARAVAFLQTTVCGSPWTLPKNPNDEECDEWRQFDIDRDMETPLPELSDKRAWWMPVRGEAPR